MILEVKNTQTGHTMYASLHNSKKAEIAKFRAFYNNFTENGRKKYTLKTSK